VPSFCRHNRLVDNCSICSKKPRVSAPRGGTVARRQAEPRGTRAARAPGASGLVVRRLQRSADDGYEHELVPGLRSTQGAARLADELAFAAARLRELTERPPGLYAEVASGEDREEAAWLAFLITWMSPLEGVDDPFAAIRAVRVSWASGELPDVTGVPLGPRTGRDPKRGAAALAAYRAWAERQRGQLVAMAGEPTWTPQHRYDRAFERLALPGFGRAQRVELLLLAQRLGLADVDPWTLHLGSAAATDPVALAARRIFGIADAVLLQRRQRELADAVAVPVAAFDLALHNWAAAAPGERVTAGASVGADPSERARIADVLHA
jgi:hypothetical protein